MNSFLVSSGSGAVSQSELAIGVLIIACGMAVIAFAFLNRKRLFHKMKFKK